MPEDETDPISLANVNFDTGKEERAGDYPLADKTYAELLERITQMPQFNISSDLNQPLLDFYGDFSAMDEATIAPLILIKKMKTKDNNR